jgi:hypothetical protein
MNSSGLYESALAARYDLIHLRAEATSHSFRPLEVFPLYHGNNFCFFEQKKCLPLLLSPVKKVT